MAAKSRPNELHITRVFDAPRDVVWNAWTDLEQVSQWWGPRGFTLTTHSKSLKPGGTWNYTMHGPDGEDYPNIATYHEVIEGTKLVYDHGATENTPPLFQVSVLFSDLGEKTKMDMTMTLPTPEAAVQIRQFIKKAGGDSTWDRLAEHVVKNTQGKDTFVIARVFAASLETVFDMWTKPEHFSRWLPPTGMRMEFLKADIRTGGASSYMMTNDAGLTMYGKVEYLEITKPEKLVYLQQFADAQGNVSRHPLASVWPETMLTTVELSAEDAESTRVRVTWEPFGKTTAEELAVFLEARRGMTMGWTGSFDKLDALIQ